VSGWGVGGDEVCDLGKAVVEPEVKGVCGVGRAGAARVISARRGEM